MRREVLLHSRIVLGLIIALSPVPVGAAELPCAPASEVSASVNQLAADLRRATGGGCLSPGDEARLLYMRAFPAELPRRAENWEGLALEGTEGEFRALRGVLGEAPTGRWPRVAAGCASVLCALEKIFDSPEAAQRILALEADTGYVITAHQLRKPPPEGQREELFSLAEIRALDQTVRELPPSFYRLATLRSFHRAPSWYSPKEDTSRPASAYASAENRNIVLYSAALRPRRIRGYVHHEIGHHVDDSKRSAESELFHVHSGFLAHSKWEKGEARTTPEGWIEQTWIHSPDAKFITEYAGLEPSEDWAENIYAYVSLPDRLYRLDAWKYERLKTQVFQGREYRVALWPALQQILARLPVMSLVEGCLAAIHEVSREGESAEDLIFKDAQGEEVARIKPAAEISSQCVPEKVRQEVLRRLRDDPKVCEWGESRIEQAISQRIAEQFDPILYKLAGAREPSRMHAQRALCEKSKDPGCWLRGLNLPAPIARRLARPEVADYLRGR